MLIAGRFYTSSLVLTISFTTMSIAKKVCNLKSLYLLEIWKTSFFCDAFSIEFPVQKFAVQMLHCFILRFFLLNRANLTFSLLTLLKRRLVSE